MADRTRAGIVIGADRESVLAVIADFPAYPEWAGQIRQARILQTGPDGKATLVRFVLDAGIIKDEYTLGYTWHGDEGVGWRMVEPGLMLSGLEGGYLLADAGTGTEVTYELTVALKVPMLGMVKRKAEKVIVDTALRELKKRVERG
ncbi:SRPBCC family protein [Rhizohabitans arisaemae]|uniref:SRPBCC family protein n=1 Tax=Rhizohabitans arisaemae TaxID=2720610 RepID=UPI0024B085A9|nr:SRPBCC family protein [Rhizohabitans arisaemae]